MDEFSSGKKLCDSMLAWPTMLSAVLKTQAASNFEKLTSLFSADMAWSVIEAGLNSECLATQALAVEFGKNIPTCRARLQEILVAEGVKRASRSPDIAIGLLRWFYDQKYAFMLVQIMHECVKHYMGNPAVMDMLFSITDNDRMYVHPFLSECLLRPSCVDMWRAFSDELLCDFFARQGPLHFIGFFLKDYYIAPDLFLKIARKWTQVLRSRPEHVVRAWMGMQHDSIKDVVLFMIAEKTVDTAAPSPQECLEAVVSSIRPRVHPMQSCWADACFSALDTLWPARCSSLVALDLLAVVLLVEENGSRRGFTKYSRLLQVVVQSCQGQQLDIGTLKCVHRILVNPEVDRWSDLDDFVKTATAWVFELVTPAKMPALRQFCMAEKEAAAELFFLLRDLERFTGIMDRKHGLVVMRVMCDLLQAVPLPNQLARDFFSFLDYLSLSITSLSCEDLKVLLGCLAHVKTYDPDYLRMLWEVSDMYARAIKAGTKLLSADVFVHPSDHAWNAKMWEMLDSVKISPFSPATLWRQLLIPSLTTIDPGHVVCYEKDKVAKQLVRRRSNLFFL